MGKQYQSKRAFDKELDKCLKEITVDTGNGRIICVGVYSYDGGEPKVGLTRTFTTASGEVGHSTIGRMTTEEATKVAQAIAKLFQK